MEDTLRGVFVLAVVIAGVGLNPCFNGRYSQSAEVKTFKKAALGLNPCFNGRYSQRAYSHREWDILRS